MNSPKTNQSPSFRNLKKSQNLSPMELKEKIRKNCKEKLKIRRNSFINNLRGVNETEIRNTLDEVYKEMFNFTDVTVTDEEEQDFFVKVKEDLVQEEIQWLIGEYEKSQLENVDWAAMEKEVVICPVCQKTNLTTDHHNLTCNVCKWTVSTDKTLGEIKNDIFNSLEKHNNTCNNEVEFASITDLQTHIFLICHLCAEMQLVV